MKVGYTEFSYGYAFTENLIRSSSTLPTGALVFPNLVQEGQSGFDVRLNFPGVPLFFQYKLPELMRRGTAKEVAQWNCPGLKVPFFRISMMRSDVSRQHELLMQLEARYPSCVFYAAAWLSSIGHFNRAYKVAAVAQQSAFFSPLEIGALPDHKVHTIAYRPRLAIGYFCSEPRQIQAHTFEGVTGQLGAKFVQDRFARIEDSAEETRESVLQLASPPMREIQDEVEARIREARERVPGAGDRLAEREQTVINILVAREIARVDLGLDLVVAQPHP